MLLGAITLISGVLGNTIHVRYHKQTGTHPSRYVKLQSA